jgi:hypothetical protein
MWKNMKFLSFCDSFPFVWASEPIAHF